MFPILLILAVVWAVIAAGGGSLFKFNSRSKHINVDVFIELFREITAVVDRALTHDHSQPKPPNDRHRCCAHRL